MDTFVPSDELLYMQRGLRYTALVSTFGFLLALANLSLGAYILRIADHTESHVDQLMALLLGNDTAVPQ